MDAMARAKMWIGGLTDIGLMLPTLAIVAAFLVGGNLPFFGGGGGNIVGMVADLGKSGLDEGGGVSYSGASTGLALWRRATRSISSRRSCNAWSAV